MSWGIQGGYAALDEILAQRMMAQKYADAQKQIATENDYKNRALQENVNSREDIARMGAQERAAAAAQSSQDRQMTVANQAADQVPPGAFIPPTDPLVGMLRTSGRGALLTPTPEQPAMGPDFVGPMPDGRTPQEAQVGRPAGFLKSASAKQLEELNKPKPNVPVKEIVGPDGKPVYAAESDAVGKTPYIKPDKAPQVQLMPIQTVDENGNSVTKIVPKVAGAEYKKGPGATVENRLKSAEAVTQTGNDIIAQLSDPAYATQVGVALGRANSVRDFIGNPPPEFAELAGEIESYALANMGVHGMRSVQGADEIKKLLDAKHTPASLAATIRGLNVFSTHFMQNEGRGAKTTGATPPAPKKTAAELIQQYGGR